MKKWMKKYWGSVSLLISVLLLCVTGSLAAYTNFSSTRRVISVKAENRMLFFSNMLYREEKAAERSVYKNKRIALTEDNCFTVEIYNYIPGDTTTYNNQTVNYTLQVTLLSGIDRYGDYSIQIGGNSTSFSKTEKGEYVAILSGQSLAGNKLSKNSYTFHLPSEEKGKVRMCVEAIPEDASYEATNQKKLTAFIHTGELTAEKNWSGHFLDDTKGCNPNNYDGFNYEISGYGQGTLKVSWNSSVLEISPWFIEDIKAKICDDSTEGWQYIEFLVGSEGQPSAYQTQFYWTLGKSDIDWTTLFQQIKVEFH